jgi:hypothetical protein
VVRKKRHKRNKAKANGQAKTNGQARAQVAKVDAPIEADAAGLARVMGKVGVSAAGETYLRR